MIRSSISRLLLTLLPGRAVAAIGDLLANELRAGWDRETALETALERALAMVDAAPVQIGDLPPTGLLDLEMTAPEEVPVQLPARSS